MFTDCAHLWLNVIRDLQQTGEVTSRVYFDVSIGGAPAGRILMVHRVCFFLRSGRLVLSRGQSSLFLRMAGLVR